MLVSELSEHLAPAAEMVVSCSLGDLRVQDWADSVSVGSEQFLLDDLGTSVLAKFLHVPSTYIKRCPPEFRAQTLNYWADQQAETDVNVFVDARGELVSVQSPDVVTVPTDRVGHMVARVFAPDDQVSVYRDFDSLHIDVVSKIHSVDVPNPQSLPFRPLVGDVTHGGVRILTRPHESTNPVVVSYLERLVCLNGMTSSQKLGKISIKGLTVEDVLEEMEAAARTVLGGLERSLDLYAATAGIPVPGSLQAFAHQLAVEYGLKRQILDEVMLIVNQLPESATVYDVLQAFTQVAGMLDWPTRMRMQSLGGDLALETERMIKRCSSCERLLP